VLGLCRQFHQLPSAIRAESVGLLRMLAVEEAGGSRPEPEEVNGGWQ
jgi:hypothetical protein